MLPWIPATAGGASRPGHKKVARAVSVQRITRINLKAVGKNPKKPVKKKGK
jgi:hypothetical protein